MSIHFLDKLNIPERFRVWYELPRIDIESEPLDTARWVVLPQRLLVYAQPDLVKSLCDKHGADRLVLFDYSDQGHGDYPCTVFATNCRNDFPKKVIGYLTPIGFKYFGRVDLQVPPKREAIRHTISFVGDVSCHPIRVPGAELLCVLGGYVKMNEQAFVDDPRIAGDEYNESFQSFAMWCPPSRQPQTWRLLEAINAGVPVITTPIWQNNRLPMKIRGALMAGIAEVHPENDLEGITRCLCSMIKDPDLPQKRARDLQFEFKQYVTHFWKFVAEQLKTLE